MFALSALESLAVEIEDFTHGFDVAKESMLRVCLKDGRYVRRWCITEK